jgi:hypothetical protein
MIGLDDLTDMGETLGRPLSTLIALARGNDPFCLAEGRMTAAIWFAEIYQRFGFTGGIHLRRIHYVLVSQEALVL